MLSHTKSYNTLLETDAFKYNNFPRTVNTDIIIFYMYYCVKDKVPITHFMKHLQQTSQQECLSPSCSQKSFCISHQRVTSLKIQIRTSALVQEFESDLALLLSSTRYPLCHTAVLHFSCSPMVMNLSSLPVSCKVTRVT